ncbi:M48 family metalloprotease [Methanobrevibacter sp.]|uniref:M48 family metalloprotease n=1 Tax=Methanobrevibacter sp. TaxID=66852 RepID=UPI0025D1CCC6|nr:M48 family metalloprotease [Methanobrevibacter sp.]MBQ2962333.1 M48 family metalloprotease [Methanobrevibacter sp.]
MAKDQRSSLNPFTGKSHFDIVNDDKFLQDSYNQYYAMVQKAQVLDNAPEGQVVRAVAVRLIKAVEAYLTKIDRMDYIKDYYDWDVHLLADKTVNAFCMPGGKIVMFSGILSIANTEERIAFILGHEMAHALLDHSRTRASIESAKNTVATATYFGSFLLDIFGMGAVGDITRASINAANIGSDFLFVKPFGRNQELEADRLGMLIIHWAGYDINQIPAFWESMSQKGGNNFEFFSTHPSDEKRIANMKALIAEINSDKDFTSGPVIGDPTVTDKTNNWSKQAPQAPKANACPKCGAAIAPEDNFCTGCGYKLK